MKPSEKMDSATGKEEKEMQMKDVDRASNSATSRSSLTDGHPTHGSDEEFESRQSPARATPLFKQRTHDIADKAKHLASQASHQAKDYGQKARVYGERALDETTTMVRKYPTQTLLGGFAVGLIIGLGLGRR